jgi:tight adherence protein B
MIVICLTCAALAVWWAVPPPARPDRMEPPLAAGPSPGSVPAASSGWSGSPGWSTVGGVLGCGLLVVAGLLLDGGRGAVLGAALAAISGTVAGLIRQRRRRGSALHGRVEVARACAALAAQLRVGQVPSEALAVAAADCPVLREARDAQDLGGDVTRVWRGQAGRPGLAGLIELARAWQVSSKSGAPMSAVLEHVADGMAAEQSLRAVVAGELSAPRATGKVMAALPGCGVGLGYLLGGEPIGWLLAGPLGWGCLLGGVILACLGVLWIEVLAELAAGRGA